MSITLLNEGKFEVPDRTPHIKRGAAEVYIDDLGVSWRNQCTHFFAEITRHGEGQCTGCGSWAWSAWWVAEGVYGDATSLWITERERAMNERLEADAVNMLVGVLGAVVVEEQPKQVVARPLPEPKQPVVAVMALMDMDEPAKRRGIPVPQMEFMRLS